MRDHFERMLQPTDGLTLTARIVTAIWLSTLLVEVTVWLIISIVGGLVFPWWLWTVLVGGLITGGVHHLARTRRQARA
jgi:hypothetical protein